MAVKNSLAPAEQTEVTVSKGFASIGEYLGDIDVRQQISSILGEKETQRFVSSVISAVTVNKELAKCDYRTILSSALLGETLQLSPSPQLGHFYMVPYKNTKTGTTEAQFQIGYKGLLQLAIRSGQYRKINVVAIKEGEFVSFNPLEEDIKINIKLDDWDKREALNTVGYYAFFELVNGYRKCIYWSKERMNSHALKYSPGYRAKKGFTFWEKDFDSMAYKTMLRHLLSKWGVMSIELRTTFENEFLEPVQEESTAKDILFGGNEDE